MTPSDNPILTAVTTMARCGWHISSVSAVRRDDGSWYAEVEVNDNVAPGDESILSDCTDYVISAPPPGPLAGAPGVTVEYWCNRPHPYRFDLPAESHDLYESWIAQTANVGNAVDYAWVGGRRWLTKPIKWQTDDIRKAFG